MPANLQVGRSDAIGPPAAAPRWAALRFTVAGIWEIEPATLAEMSAPVQVVDVREAEEFTGPLGHIRGAKLIPLDQLANRVGELSRTTPVVTVCRSGARSAQAVVLLQRAGVEQAANLSGGMLRWVAEHHAVESTHR